MPSLYFRPDSSCWWVSYRTRDGLRKRASTGQTDKAAAQAVLSTLLAAEGLGSEGRLTEQRARELIGEIVERTMGERTDFYTTRGWFDAWLQGKRLAKAVATLLRYEGPVKRFLLHLRSRADVGIESVRTKDIQSFWESERATGKSCETCNIAVKIS